MSAPRLFLSYSWTTPEYESHVVQLATELRSAGVDVVLDKWDLREGHDAIAFMEQMVTAPDVKKVALLCDRRYVDRANSREGGVGAEAQILTPELYARTSQDKFVAVVMERDGDGKALLPAYYKGRIYIDLSDASTYSTEYDRLLRWVYDKPLYVRPQLGTPPTFVSAHGIPSPLSPVTFQRALDCVRNQRTTMEGAVAECFAGFARQLETLRIPRSAEPFDDFVVASIEAFLPTRNQLLEIVTAGAQFPESPILSRCLHKLFEELLSYLDPPAGTAAWRDSDFDNFRFIILELWLLVVAVLIKYERFGTVAEMLDQPFYAPERPGRSAELVFFPALRRSFPALVQRVKRLDLRRSSLAADLIKERCVGLAVEFRHVLQADFLLFLNADLRGELLKQRWWPETLVFASHQLTAFEVFARARSRKFLARLSPVLGNPEPATLAALVQGYRRGTPQLPSWQFDSFDPGTLMGFAELGTIP